MVYCRRIYIFILLNFAMNRLASFVLCICLLFAGCVDQKGKETRGSAKDPLSVAITSPASGAVISGNKDIKFECAVKGGDKPYTYY
jgi:hypothetical protein